MSSQQSMFFICIGSNLTLDCVASRQGLHNGHSKARHESIWSNTAINRALEIQDQRTIDHTFMAIEFVCWFETISEFESCLTRAAIHMVGMMTILSMRGPEQFATEMGRRLFLSAVFLWVGLNTQTLLSNQTEPGNSQVDT